jgi:heat shock protein HtpX
MTGARIIQEADNPNLFNLIQEVTIASGLPMPKVAIVVDSAPNAFATGRNPEHALIAFTTGILEVMDRDQLQGVVAHEMSHVANRDTLVSAIAATTAGAIALLSDFLMRMMWFGGRRDSRDSNSNPIALVISLVVMLHLLHYCFAQQSLDAGNLSRMQLQSLLPEIRPGYVPR